VSRPTFGILLSTVLILACERTPPASARKDTVVPVVPPPETTAVVVPEPSTWDSSAGPALFVLGPATQDAFIIAPRFTDTTAIDSARFDKGALRAKQLDLFTAGARIGQARITAVTAPVRSDSCRAWPTARLDHPVTDTASHDWAVGFETSHAVEWPMDSIAGLPRSDSVKLAVDIARIASALPGDTAAAFRGLPFVVTKAWRTRESAGAPLVIALVVRNVNQEASPRQERILLIAERDTSTTTTRYTPRYFERVAGVEETVETTDILALVLLGNERRPTLVVARDSGNGSSFALIERVSGTWQRLWASAYAGC
jgi:hypothetical protein